MKPRSAILALLAASIVLCAAVGPTHAAPSVIKGILMGGYHDNPEDAFVGIGLLVDLLKFQGAIYGENVLVDSGFYRDINLDIYYSLVTLVAIYGYIGVGTCGVFAESDSTGSEGKMGLNLVAGVRTRLIPLKPFVQFKFTTLPDWEDPLEIGLGIHF